MRDYQWWTGADGVPGEAMAACLTAATAAPSVHNTQPWLFRPLAMSVDVFVDRSRQLAVADSDGRELHVSVGAALFNLRLAMLARGRLPLVRLLPDDTRPDLVASVLVGRAVTVPDEVRSLADAIANRHTVRRPYWSRRLPASVLAALVDAARQERTDLGIADPAARDRVLGVVRSAEDGLRADLLYRSELAWWAGGRPGRADGVPAAAYGPRPQLAALPLRDFDLAHTSPRPVAAYEAAPTIALLYTDDDTPRDWLIAGQALERVLLTATVHKVAAAPMTQAIAVPELRRRLGAPDDPRHVQSVLRLGYAGHGPRTPRRPLADVLIRPTRAEG